MNDDTIWDDRDPRERMKRSWERGYVQGALDMLFLLALFDLLDTAEDRCVRCGERTNDWFETFGYRVYMCAGCQ